MNLSTDKPMPPCETEHVHVCRVCVCVHVCLWVRLVEAQGCTSVCRSGACAFLCDRELRVFICVSSCDWRVCLSLCVDVTVCGLSSSRLWFQVKYGLSEDTPSANVLEAKDVGCGPEGAGAAAPSPRQNEVTGQNPKPPPL